MNHVTTDGDRRSLAALLEHHANGATYYLPSFEVWPAPEYRCDCPIVFALPMSYYYPLHGTSFDQPKPTKEATMSVSLGLFLLEVAQEAHATVVIEQVADDKIWDVCESNVRSSPREKNVLKATATKYLRFHILFTDESAGLAGDIMTARLAPVVAADRPTKRQRLSSAADGGSSIVGDYTVSAARINSEKMLYTALMEHNMGLADVRGPGEMTYSLSTPAGPVTAAAAAVDADDATDADRNRFDDDSDDEIPENIENHDAADANDRRDGDAIDDDKFPQSHVFRTLSLPIVAASYQHELLVQACNASDEQADLAAYFQDGTWRPGRPGGSAERRRLFTVLDFRGRGAAWWNSSFALPQWPAPLEKVIERVTNDHHRRGLQAPDIAHVTFEELNLMHQPGPNGEPREMQAHGTFHPIQVTTEARLAVSAASSHGEQVLADVFRQFSGYRGIITCLRTVGARSQNTMLWVDMVNSAVDNIYAEHPEDDECGTPACYSQAREAFTSAIHEMSDPISPLACTIDSAVFHVEKKVGANFAMKRYDDFLYSSVIAYNKRGLKQTQRQSDTWLPLFMAACSLGYHKLGAQIMIYLAGDIDIGKSTLMKMVKDSLPRSLTVDMGTSTEASLRATNCGRLSTVDDVGPKQGAQEHQNRTTCSDGYIGECKKVRDADGNWVFKAFMHLRMLGHIWCGNVVQSAQILSRSIPIMTLGEKVGKSAPKALNRSKFDMSVAPKDETKRKAALVRNKVLITGTYHLYLLEAIGAVQFNDTMMPIMIALSRELLGDEFSLSSRLVEHAYKFAISYMVLFLTSMWNTYILPLGYTRTETQTTADGRRITRKVVSPVARRDEVLFYAANATLRPMHCARVLLMLKRTSNNKSLYDKVDIAFKMLIEFEEGGTLWQTDPNAPDFVILKIPRAAVQNREVKELVPWCPGMGDENGMLATFYDQMLQKRHGDELVMSNGTGKFAKYRSMSKAYLLQAGIRGPYEDKIWHVLLWVMANRDDLWTVSYDETSIVFRSPVTTLLAAPGSPAARDWSPDGHLEVPPALRGEKNPDRPGSGLLDRALWIMSQRDGFSSHDQAQGGKVFRPSKTPAMLDVWPPCDDDGLAMELRGGGEEGCRKMSVNISNAIEVDYNYLMQTSEALATDEDQVRPFTRADETLINAALYMEPNSGIVPGDSVVIGTQPVCPEGGQCYTTHTFREPVGLPTLDNPNHVGAAPPEVAEYDFGEVIGGAAADTATTATAAFDTPDSTESFADHYMPPTEPRITLNQTMYAKLQEAHQRRVLGFTVPAHLNADNCNLPRIEYTIVARNEVWPLHVVQGALIADAAGILFGENVVRVCVIHAGDSRVEDISLAATTHDYAAGAEFEVTFES